MSFAVIDFETTGLMPERHDRVIEVGVVLTDDRGRSEYEWTTLVNPHRDAGNAAIHGIRSADLAGAPDFDEIADFLIGLLSGRTVVAHNASFDMRFLHAELARASYNIAARPPALCSMKWAGRIIGAAKLQHCCEALDIELIDAHTALADARATAELVARLQQIASVDPAWQADALASARFGWPPRRRALATPRSAHRS